MTDTIVALLLLVSFFAFFAGYAIGRRAGKKEGFLEGSRYAPLALRRESWLRGTCLICGAAARKAEPALAPTSDSQAVSESEQKP